MAASPRIVRVGADDDALLRALAEHRQPAAGWQVESLALDFSDDRADFPRDGRLIVLDLDHGDAQRRAVDAIRARGFAGHILTLGSQDGGASPNQQTIQRPVRLGTLLARIDSVWQEAEASAATRFGPYEFLSGASVLQRVDDDSLVRLTELECKLLVFLAEAEGELVGREQLLAGVWGYSAGVDTHTVETLIWRLRQKIETDDPATRFLVTETGGYRLLSDGVRDGE
jgi:DNA-binding response OmpR family regulator